MSFEEMLKNLRAEYLASIPGKIVEIESYLAAGDHNGVREAFHKLKGTGKTYGLPEVSELGAVVEKLCIERPHLAQNGGALAVALLRDIHQARVAQSELNLQSDARMQQLLKL